MNFQKFVRGALLSALVLNLFYLPATMLQAKPIKGSSIPVAMELVDINKANSDDLQLIKGIGPSLAERIVNYREANGKFEKLEDLLNVRGIGEAKFDKIKAQIKV